MFFKRRFLSLILALFLLAGLTSCGGPPEDAGSGPSASDLGQEAQPSDQPEDPSLSQLRRELDEGGYFCGIAFLGNLPDGDPEALPRVIREAGYLEAVSYTHLDVYKRQRLYWPRHWDIKIKRRTRPSSANHPQYPSGDVILACIQTAYGNAGALPAGTPVPADYL